MEQNVKREFLRCGELQFTTPSCHRLGGINKGNMFAFMNGFGWTSWINTFNGAEILRFHIAGTNL